MKVDWVRPGAFVALILLASCIPRDRDDPSRDVALLAGGTEPMTMASGIQLGMTARKLKELRPNVRPEAYAGYSERVGDYAIWYGIPGSNSETQVVPDGSRITSVSVELNSQSDSVVTALWEKSTRDLAAVLAESPRCVRLDGSNVKGKAMLWRRGSVDILAVATEKPNVRGGPVAAKFYVFVGKSPWTSVKESSEPCPTEGVWTQ